MGGAGAAQLGPAADRDQGPPPGGGPADPGRCPRPAAGRDVHDRPGRRSAPRGDHHRGPPRSGHRRCGRLPGRPGFGARPRRSPSRGRGPPARRRHRGHGLRLPRRARRRTFWANVVAGVDSVTEVPATRWDPDLYFDRDRSRTPGADAVEVGRVHPSRAVRRPGLRHPAVVAGRDRAGAAPRPRGGGPGPRRRRLRRWPPVPPRAHVGGLRGRGRHRPGRRLRAPIRPAVVLRGAAARPRRAPPSAHRGLLPRRAHQRHRRPHRQPARPGRGQLHRRRRLRRLARRPRHRLQGAADGHQRHGAVRWRRPAQRHPRLPDVRLGARPLTHRPVRHLRRRGRRDRPRRGGGVRRPEAAGGRRARRRPDLRGGQSGRRIKRRQSLGLTAPRPEGQRAALDRAYGMAGVSPSQVGLVEAHGTGTVVGDRTELATLTEVFVGAARRPGRSCSAR